MTSKSTLIIVLSVVLIFIALYNIENGIFISGGNIISLFVGGIIGAIIVIERN